MSTEKRIEALEAARRAPDQAALVVIYQLGEQPAGEPGRAAVFLPDNHRQQEATDDRD